MRLAVSQRSTAARVAVFPKLDEPSVPDLPESTSDRRRRRHRRRRLGFEGYRSVQGASRDVAKYLSSAIEKMGPFDLCSDGSDIPVFAWKLKEGHKGHWTLYDLSDRLRMRGWLVSAYPMPDNLAAVTVQRIVVRNGLSRDLAGSLLIDIESEVAYLQALEAPMPAENRSRPHHH